MSEIVMNEGQDAVLLVGGGRTAVAGCRAGPCGRHPRSAL